MDLKEIGHEGVDWIHVGQGRNHWCAIVIVIVILWIP
jgi:hypothetical protein